MRHGASHKKRKISSFGLGSEEGHQHCESVDWTIGGGYRRSAKRRLEEAQRLNRQWHDIHVIFLVCRADFSTKKRPTHGEKIQQMQPDQLQGGAAKKRKLYWSCRHGAANGSVAKVGWLSIGLFRL